MTGGIHNIIGILCSILHRMFGMSVWDIVMFIMENQLSRTLPVPCTVTDYNIILYFIPSKLVYGKNNLHIEHKYINYLTFTSLYIIIQNYP